MPNTLGAYNPTFFANEALIWLQKALGMAGRVHRGYDKTPTQKGETITIRRPATFTAVDAPQSAVDLTTESVSITVDKWKEVKYALTDKEMSFTQEQIVQEHIMPAAYAIADAIDQDLAGLYKFIPWFTDVGATAAPADITAARKILFDNRVPMRDLHMMIDSDMEADFLGNSAFSQWQGAGQSGANTQMTGSLGEKYGFEIFANQNVLSHTKGTASTGTLAANGAAAVGATTVALDAGSVTGTLVAGDSLVFAGHTQRYVVTATATAATNAFASVSIFPELKAAVADNEVCTVSLDNHSAALGFHRGAFALAMAPLSEFGNGRGAEIATVIDPVTGLALRSRLFYDGNTSKNYISVDALYGVKTLNPNLAVRLRN
jgi:hypothetical protein